MRLKKFIAVVTLVISLNANGECNKHIMGTLEGFEKPEHPGLVLLLSDGHGEMCKEALGLANIELGVPLTTQSVFEIGSITKLFTATAVLLLEQQGKLKRADPISHYIAGINTQKEAVTIEHLLSHTSGLVDPINDPEFLSTRIQESVTLLELVNTFKNGYWQEKPGKNVIYSNVGYSLLSYIIEKVSGTSYEDYLKRHIFKPLRMNNTSQASFAIARNKATGYTYDGESPRQHDFLNWRWAFGAADLLSSVSDLYTFNQALMSQRLLNSKQLSVLTRPIRLSDGTFVEGSYNYAINNIKGSKSLRMNGSTLGFSSHIAFIPSSETFLVILSNSDGVNGGAWNAPESIASTLLNIVVRDETASP